MDIAVITFSIGALIFLSYLFSHLFRSYQIPDVLFLVAIGLILGPATGIVDADRFGIFGEVFVMLTLIVILFEAGLTIRINDILKQAGPATALMLVTLVTTIGIAGTLGYFFLDFSILESVLVGILLGGVSGGIIIPLLKYLPVSEETKSLLSFEANLNDVLTISLVFAVLEYMKAGVIDIQTFSISFGSTLVIALGIGAVAGLFWSQTIEKIRHIQDNIFMTPALVLLVFGITEMIGASGIFAVFAFGITLGNLQLIKSQRVLLIFKFDEFQLSKWEKRMFSGLVFLMKTYFFVFLGIAIGFDNIPAIAVGVAAAALLFVARYLIVQAMFFKSKLPEFDRSVLARALPKGLVGAALITLVQNQTAQDYTYVVILLSIIFTSALVYFLPRPPEEPPGGELRPERRKEPDVGAKEELSEGKPQEA